MSYTILIFSDHDHLVGSKLIPASEPPKEWNFLQWVKNVTQKDKLSLSMTAFLHCRSCHSNNEKVQGYHRLLASQS